MADVRFIVKCVQFHRDGNTDPQEAKPGAVLNLNENQWLRLRQSAPFSFELVERRAPVIDQADIPPSTKSEPLDITEAVQKQIPESQVDPAAPGEPTIRAADLAAKIAGEPSWKTNPLILEDAAWLESMTVAEIVAAVDSGEISARQALDLESLGKARKSLISRLNAEA